MEASTIKTCCDNVQKRLQKEFDRNIDIFDRYIKKNVAAVTATSTSFEPSPAATAAGAVAGAGAMGGEGSNGAGGGGGGGGSGATAALVPAAGSGSGGGGDGGDVGGGALSVVTASPSEKRGAARSTDGWALDGVDEATPPKRLKEEEDLDAEIQKLRTRRREVGG